MTGGVTTIDTVGGMVSTCTEVVSVEAVLSLSAKSWTPAALTVTVTSPSEVAFGVIVTVYTDAPSVPDARAAVAGPGTVKSAGTAKPFTGF